MQNSTTEMVAIESLVLDPANARKHDAKNLEAIKGSIARFGQRKPIVVDINNVVLAGNGTLTALRALGKTEVWIARTELKGAEAIAFSLADNRTSDLSVFDDEILGKTLQALREDGFDIGEIGFDVGDFFDEKEPDPPDDTTEEKPEVFSLTVTFENDDQQQDLFLELRDRGFKVKV
jgi:ParB-like chromosome segregation protein Spo0J